MWLTGRDGGVRAKNQNHYGTEEENDRIIVTVVTAQRQNCSKFQIHPPNKHGAVSNLIDVNSYFDLIGVSSVKKSVVNLPEAILPYPQVAPLTSLEFVQPSHSALDENGDQFID